MKKQIPFWILITLGVILILFSVFSSVLSPYLQKQRAEKAKETALSLEAFIPQRQKGTFDDRSDMTMPSVEFEKENYACIIEIPKFETTLPVYSRFENKKLRTAPCRYSGSIYNRTLVIGGSGNVGQFDFMKNITEGDCVFITDMTGLEYSFTVSEIILTKKLDAETLSKENSALTIFAKESLGDTYTIIYCLQK